MVGKNVYTGLVMDHIGMRPLGKECMMECIGEDHIGQTVLPLGKTILDRQFYLWGGPYWTDSFTFGEDHIG